MNHSSLFFIYRPSGHTHSGLHIPYDGPRHHNMQVSVVQGVSGRCRQPGQAYMLGAVAP